MNEVIITPDWNKFDIKCSKNILNFFNYASYNASQKNIELSKIKDYFNFNRMECQLLILELKLRGIIETEELSNSDVVIINKNDGMKYKNINYSICGLNNFINYFKVQNDDFFNYIPIKLFKCINKDCNIKIIEDQFLKAGFEIEHIPFEQTDETTISEDYSIKLDNMEELEGLTTFKNYCRNHNIFTINDLKQQNINELFTKVSGIGEKKKELIIKAVDKYSLDVYQNVNNYKELTVRNYFFESYFKQIVEYASCNNIILVNDLLKEQDLQKIIKSERKYDASFIKNKFRNKKDEFESMRFMKFIDEISDEQRQLRLSNFIVEKKYIDTLSFLEEKGILTIEDFIRIVKKYNNEIPMITNYKVRMIENILYYTLTSTESNNYEISQSILDFKIEDFFYESAIHSFTNFCKKNNIEFIKNLKDKNLKLFLSQIPNFGNIKSDYVIDKIMSSKYKCEGIELMNVLLNEIESNENYSILINRIIKDKTLEEIGTELGLTRERIRQQEASMMRQVGKICNMIFQIILSMNPDLKVITLDDLSELFKTSERAKIVYSALSQNSNLLSIECINEKLYVKKNSEDMKNTIIEIVSNYDEPIIKLDKLKEDSQKYIEEYDGLFDYFDLLNILQNNDYYLKNDILIKKGTTSAKLYNSLFREYYPNGLRLDDDGCNELQGKYDELIGVEQYRADKSRNVLEKIHRNEENILCGPNTFINIDNVKVSSDLLEKIKKLIEKYYDETMTDAVTSAKVFELYQSEINDNSINNDIFLYGVMKYYYSDEFVYNKLWIYKNSTENTQRNALIYEHVKQFKNGISKEEIMNNFGITRVVLDKVISLNKELIEWNNRKYLITKENINISKELKERIEMFIDELSARQNGFLNIKTVYRKFDLYLDDAKVNDYRSLLEYVKYYHPEYTYKYPLFATKKIEENMGSDYFYSKYFQDNDIIRRKDFERYCSQYEVAESQVYGTLKNELPKLYQINLTDYVKTMNVSDEVIKNVKEYFDERIEKYEYIILSSLEINGDIFKFGQIDYSWNQYILKTIIDKYIKSLTLVYIPDVTSFTESAIVVNKKLNISNYNEFLMYELNTDKYKDIVNINQLTERFQYAGFINKSLPYDFVELLDIDEFGRIRNREV